MMKSFFSKIKKILFDYDAALKAIKKEKGIKHAFWYLIVFLLFTQFFMVFYYSEVSLPKAGFAIDLSVEMFLVIYIITLAVLVGFTFLRPWLTNLFVKLFQKKAVFADTYKVMVYGASPGYVVTPFFVGFMMGIVFLPKTGLWLLVLALLGVISLAGLIYEWILRVKGMMKIHKISVWPAILCLYVFPLLLLILIEVVLVLLFVGLLASQGYFPVV